MGCVYEQGVAELGGWHSGLLGQPGVGSIHHLSLVAPEDGSIDAWRKEEDLLVRDAQSRVQPRGDLGAGGGEAA